MKASDVMTHSPATCGPDTSIEQVARAMLTHDCGSIPVVDGERIVGVVTDRDIVIRAIAAGKCPLKMTAADLMSKPVVLIQSDDSIEATVRRLEENRLRRAPVVDSFGHLVGMVAQADIALQAPRKLAAELVHDVSQGMDIGHR
jgi:CBS domain-containing protein